ncbi:tripartite tricarboxylate transporter TctB family protein [Alkalihalobacillus oceani]|uniref:Tripartite tricarboxylate transporter TctB family protein n=1 Tax=Halalkalibacter oceani TaxID=1653776 RepID=A0A9X2DRF1_9BACI|nr:tripartite tricarboxylate transporter TctB family protein [Halalkalibacter oceani]MCM3715736.1 tripartite tricarboxylate transporter TctB family protein [Halalkalibacter oceani]
MTKTQADLLLSVVIFIVAIAFWIPTRELRQGSLFPSAVIAIMTLLAIVLFLKSIFIAVKKKRPKDTFAFQKEKAYSVAGIAVAGVLYVYIIPFVGYYTMTVIFTSLLFILMSRTPFNWKTVGRSLLGGCFVTIFIYVAFGYMLNVRTPAGILF